MGSGNDEKESEEQFEALVSLVASVASHLSSHGISYRLVSTDEVFPYGFGLEHLRGVLTYLAVAARCGNAKVEVLDWARESLTIGDVVLVFSRAPRGEWSALASPSLHFVETEGTKIKQRAAHAS
jgi:hypothetical protein